MSTLTLWFWVRHDPLYRVRSVKVSPDTDVQNLRKSLGLRLQVPLDAVYLYKAPENHPMPIDGDYEAILGSLCMANLGRPLCLADKVASMFTEENHIHLIVDATTSLSISCWIRGSDPEPFRITLPNREFLHVLKFRIRELYPSFKGVPISEMRLYNISFSDKNEPREIIDYTGKGERVLANQFNDIPFSSRALEVVVEVSKQVRALLSSHSSIREGDTIQTRRQYFLDCTQEFLDEITPSSLSQYGIEDGAIPCGRPHDIVPTTLLHPAFGQFIEDVRTIQTTRDDHQFTQELVDAMLGRYKNKRKRVEKIHKVFGGYNIHLTKTKTPLFETDGDISINGHCYVIVDFKSEIWCCPREPCLRAMDRFVELTRSTAPVTSYSPLPCLILAIFGPYILFVCAAWNKRPTAELLSMPVAFHVPRHDTKNFQLLARHMAAFRRATETLRNYYDTLRPPTVRNVFHSQLFPYPTTFTSLVTNTEEDIVYQEQRSERNVFFGFEGSVDIDSKGYLTGDRICIKFARRYSLEAHEYCASLGFAPTLLGFQEIPGGWFMVVMEDLSEEYESLSDKPVSRSIEPLIAEKLTQFHQAGFVHGDIRDVNIMVSRSDKAKFKFVDFDWAGKVANELKYPPLVNTEVWRPTGAVDEERILSAHDHAMLSQIYHPHD